MRVPTYNRLLPIMPGITTNPGRLPKFKLVLPSLSSNTRQLFARGNKAPDGKRSFNVALNCASITDKESFCELEAIPMTPRGKSEGLKSDNDWCEDGEGWEG